MSASGSPNPRRWARPRNWREARLVGFFWVGVESPAVEGFRSDKGLPAHESFRGIEGRILEGGSHCLAEKPLFVGVVHLVGQVVEENALLPGVLDGTECLGKIDRVEPMEESKSRDVVGDAAGEVLEVVFQLPSWVVVATWDPALITLLQTSCEPLR